MRHDYSMALRDQMAALAYSNDKKVSFENTPLRRAYGFMERRALKSAETYYWSAEIIEAVVHSAGSLPQDTMISFDRFMPYRSLWFWFQREITIESVGRFRALLITYVPELQHGAGAVVVMAYSDRGGAGLELLVSNSILKQMTVGHLQNIAEDSAHKIAMADRQLLDGVDFGHPADANTLVFLSKLFLAGLFWTEQKVVAVDHEPSQKHVREHAIRSGIQQAEMIRVVHLRRAESEESHQTENSKDWTCQWFVRGHWRQQWYPSRGERSPLWIMPYVKGPEDKPLKAPAQTVFAVTR